MNVRARWIVAAIAGAIAVSGGAAALLGRASSGASSAIAPCATGDSCRAHAPRPAVTVAKIEGRPRLLSFSSRDCAACARMKPVLAAVERGCGAANDVLRIDVDEDVGAALAARYDVISLPSFVSVDASGDEIARVTGVAPHADLARALEEIRGARCATLAAPADSRPL